MPPPPSEPGRRPFRWLLEPGARLREPSRRATAVLFAGCLLALLGFFASYDIYLTQTRPGYEPPWPGYALLLTAYALVRAGYYLAAASLTLATLPVVAFVLVVTGNSPNPPVTLTFPVLSILLGTLLVDARTTALVALGSGALLLGTVVLPVPHRLPLHMVAGPLLVVGLGGAIGVLSIVHRSRLERDRRKALEDSAAELEMRVKERTAELARTITELESFAYSVSHDLRAPLRAVEAFAAILAEDHADRLGPEGLETLSVIRTSGARMSVLIDSLLLLSRVTRAPLARTEVDVVPVVRTVLHSLQVSEPSRALTLVLPERLVVNGDPALVSTILENLLGNAWKFSKHTEHPRIEVSTTVRDGRSYCVVRDNGAGFDMRHAERLFHPFERLHQGEEFSGTGIGLATVERAVHRHGGTIVAESEVGRGATFMFSLGG